MNQDSFEDIIFIGAIIIILIAIFMIIILSKCCSFVPLFFAIIFASILGFIFNAVFFFYPKYFKSIVYMEFIVVFIQIFFLIGIIIGIIFIRKRQTLEKKDIPQAKIFSKIKCLSCTLTIFFFLLYTYSLINLIFCTFMNNKDDKKVTKPGPNIVFYFLDSFFCIVEFVLFTSLLSLGACKKCCDKCFNCCNKDKSQTGQTQVITENSSSNVVKDINNTPPINIQETVKPEPIIISINEKKKDNMDIIFKITSGKIIKINAPPFITIEKLINFLFKKVNIEGQTNDIIFLFNSEKLNKKSQDKLCDKLINNINIIVTRDTNSIIKFMEAKLELIYDEN